MSEGMREYFLQNTVHAEYRKAPDFILYLTYIFTDCPRINIHI